MSITGPSDGSPAKVILMSSVQYAYVHDCAHVQVGVAVVDVITGLYTVSAISAALVHRQVHCTSHRIACLHCFVSN